MTLPHVGSKTLSRFIRRCSGMFALLRRGRAALIVAGIAIAAAPEPASAAPEAFRFTHVGVPEGEETSAITAMSNDGTVAGGSISHIVQGSPPHRERTSVRWSPSDGLQTLPRLPGNAKSGGILSSPNIYVRDITHDGSKMVFNSRTFSGEGMASAICSSDGTEVFPLTSRPGGQKMGVANQLSDDATIVFGYSTDSDGFPLRASRWTAATGFEFLPIPAEYDHSIPAAGAISENGLVSAGSLSTRDADFNIIAGQAYRWTATGGIEGLGYLPGQDRSSGSALSSDGTTIVGTSSILEQTAGDGEVFVWREDTGMKNLHGPEEIYEEYTFLFGAGISADGNVIAIAWWRAGCSECGEREYVSYITSPDKDYYVDFVEAVARAGGSNAIQGWSNFTISGVSDDGNTVYGSAVNPTGRVEGIIARFPAGFLRALTEPARLRNISSRLHVGSGEQVSIAGFIVTGNEPKRVILRGIGPSLAAQGVSDALADPVLELHKPDGTVVTNDDWRTSQQVAIKATQVAPTNDKEAAIVAALPPGQYTVVLSGKGATVGTGLIEVYDLRASNSKLANISTRGFVGTGDNALIGGIILDTPVRSRVLFRAIGPSLEASGITTALADPLIELHNGDGALITTNDNWREQGAEEVTNAIEATGIAPTDDRESALLFSLDGGAYTAVVRGARDETGVGLVEVYDLGTFRAEP